MKKLKELFGLFFLFLKIGLTTFGGGYAMISVFEDECVSKRSLITAKELMEVVTIAESTPGPIAINGATYIGYKRAGILGSIFATIGLVLPSFIIIYIISLFLNEFLALEIVAKAFNGIKCAIGIIIVMAAVKLFKGLKKSPLNVVLFIITTIFMVLVDVFAVNFSAIWVVIIGGALGIILTATKKEPSNKNEGGKK